MKSVSVLSMLGRSGLVGRLKQFCSASLAYSIRDGSVGPVTNIT